MDRTKGMLLGITLLICGYGIGSATERANHADQTKRAQVAMSAASETLAKTSVMLQAQDDALLLADATIRAGQDNNRQCIANVDALLRNQGER